MTPKKQLISGIAMMIVGGLVPAIVNVPAIGSLEVMPKVPVAGVIPFYAAMVLVLAGAIQLIRLANPDKQEVRTT